MRAAISIKKSRSLFQRYGYQAKQSRAQEDGKEKWGRFNPKRKRRIGVRRGVIPRERGAEERRGAKEQNLSIPSIISQTQTTKANPRVCVHLEAPDGVPGAETVQQTGTVGSG